MNRNETHPEPDAYLKNLWQLTYLCRLWDPIEEETACMQFVLKGIRTETLLKRVLTHEMEEMELDTAAFNKIGDTDIRLGKLLMEEEEAYAIYCPTTAAEQIERTLLANGDDLGLQREL